MMNRREFIKGALRAAGVAAGSVEAFKILLQLGGESIVREAQAEHQFISGHVGGGTWSPLLLPGIEVWHRADLGITPSGSYVSGWADLSGNGRNLAQGSGTLQPLYVASAVNGCPAVRFDGSNDYLISSFGTIAQPNHIFMVAKQITWVANQALYSTANGGARSELIQSNTATPAILQYSGTGNENINAGWAMETYALVEALFYGSSSRVVINADATVASGGNPGTNGIAGLILGALSNFANAGNVEIAEFLLCSGQIAGADLTLLCGYINGRYDLW